MAAGNSPIQSSTLPPACPRCDYDQSGEVSRWTDTCPLEGVCSECGLAFEWGDALVPDRARVRGFVEHAERKRVFSTAWRTWWWALRPWYFWGRVRLEHRPRVERMLWWMFMVLALPRLVQIVAVCATEFVLYFDIASSMALADWLTDLFRMLLEGVVDFNDYWGRDDSLAIFPSLVAFATATVAFPAVLLCLPWTRQKAKVRRSHLARAFVYSLAPLVPIVLLRFVAWMALVVGMVLGESIASTGFLQTQQVERWCDAAASFAQVYGPWVGLAWLQVWWWFALSRGFRIKGTGPLWFVLALCSGLASLVAVVVAHPIVVAELLGE